MSGADVVARVLGLAQRLPASAWRDYANPLLRWDVMTFTAGNYWVEVVRQQYGDFWRVHVLPVGAPSWSVPLLWAEGPLRHCLVQQMRVGPWYAAVMATMPLHAVTQGVFDIHS